MSKPTLAIPMFIKTCKEENVISILDIGAGDQTHSNIFRKEGFSVITNDIKTNADLIGLYIELPKLDQKIDAIWCAHVLEHQRNVGFFLDRVFSDLRDSGILCITVPPLKHKIVGGHLTLWNAGLLLYNLILAGFDCSEAKIAMYGNNISIIIKKKTAKIPGLYYDRGDIKLLHQFFPKSLKAKEGFDGQISQLNW